jgi:hypothetical protein
MRLVSVVYIGYTGKSLRQARPHIRLPHKAVTARVNAARHVENAFVREEFHDRVEVVAVERVEKCLQEFHRHALRHSPISLWELVSDASWTMRDGAVAPQCRSGLGHVFCDVPLGHFDKQPCRYDKPRLPT